MSGCIHLTGVRTPANVLYMNLIIGTSKTVHNAKARTTRDLDAPEGTPRAEGVTWEWVKVPTCSVDYSGKTMTYTDAPVTCKTCAKRA